MNDIERVARVMGMKPHREVLEVRKVDGGHLAHTKDEQWTLVRDDGTTAPAAAPELTHERDSGVVEPELASGGIVKGTPPIVGENGPEEAFVRGTVKPAPKRRGHS